MNLIGSYNYELVALSVLIAIFSSYAALDLASRITAAVGWTRSVWLVGGAVAMGAAGAESGGSGDDLTAEDIELWLAGLAEAVDFL